VILLHQVVERLAQLAAEWMAAGFVHGDLTPSHVILTPDRRARLVDFGLAHPIGGAPAGVRGGAGTPAYVSPEAAAGRFGDPTSSSKSLTFEQPGQSISFVLNRKFFQQR
jgi:serine/threonine-protein kinase